MGSVSGALEGFFAGFSCARKGKPAEFHIAQDAIHKISVSDIVITASCEESWTGGPVLVLPRQQCKFIALCLNYHSMVVV